MAPKRLVAYNRHIDPVEQHIMLYLEKMQHQNKKLTTYIAKTGAWTHMKRLEEWKPFDFYNYFCNKFQEKYRKQYRPYGSLVQTYQRIEDFINQNGVSKKSYKQFIDKAFDRYFNGINIPHISHICSINLYSFLVKEVTANVNNLRNLDNQLAKENEKFEEYIRRHHTYGYNHKNQATV